MHEPVVFKTQEIRQKKTVIPERWEANYVSPAIAQRTEESSQLVILK